jgi:hypothetical protein
VCNTLGREVSDDGEPSEALVRRYGNDRARQIQLESLADPDNTVAHTLQTAAEHFRERAASPYVNVPPMA